MCSIAQIGMNLSKVCTHKTINEFIPNHCKKILITFICCIYFEIIYIKYVPPNAPRSSNIYNL